MTAKAWEAMQSTCGGPGPELMGKSFCGECGEEQRQNSKLQEQSSEYRTAIMQRLQMEEANQEALEDGFYVSKTWLRSACSSMHE